MHALCKTGNCNVYFGKILATKVGKVEDCYHDRHLPKHFSKSGACCLTQKQWVALGPRLYPSFPTETLCSGDNQLCLNLQARGPSVVALGCSLFAHPKDSPSPPAPRPALLGHRGHACSPLPSPCGPFAVSASAIHPAAAPHTVHPRLPGPSASDW